MKIKLVKLKKCKKCDNYRPVSYDGVSCSDSNRLLELLILNSEDSVVIGCPKEIEKTIRKNG